MFIFDSVNKLTNENERIIGKSVIEICGSVLEYYNGTKPDNIDYTVLFSDKNGNKLCEISEDSLKYAIHGADYDSFIQAYETMLKEDAANFMSVIHSNIDIIQFNNPVRVGEAYFDSEYNEEDDEEEDEDEDEDEDEEDEKEEINYNK